MCNKYLYIAVGWVVGLIPTGLGNHTGIAASAERSGGGEGWIIRLALERWEQGGIRAGSVRRIHGLKQLSDADIARQHRQ